MSKVFLKRSETNKCSVAKDRTLRRILDIDKLELDDVALFNWGTTDKKEINRALVELVGCSTVNDDPLDSVLDPTLGTTKIIYKPIVWKPDKGFLVEKTHTIKVKKRLPMPAISISKLSSWFIPEKDTCEIEYAMEGVSARADKVDFEVHAHKYYAPDGSGGTDPSDTMAEAGSTHIIQKQKCFELKDPRPTAAQKITTWKGESEAEKGILKKGGSAVYINAGCAPYTVLLRSYKDDADNKAKITLLPFYPRWDHGVLDESSLIAHWDIKDDHGKLKAGQLLVWDKDGNVVFQTALSRNILQTEKKYDLLKGTLKKWDKGEIKQDKMPYRVQIQAHSDADEEKGLAVAVMHTMVRAYSYTKVQFIAFNIKPGTKLVGTKLEYLGDDDHATDIAKRCGIMADAVKEAYKDSKVLKDDPSVLKVFMAPEFYFRGKKGGYPTDEISSIAVKMREETDKIEYADWLFVWGTAIGYTTFEKSPDDTEIQNVALVQKGWPGMPPDKKDLKAAAVYKEYVSHIDFIRDAVAFPKWDDPSGSDRKITIHDKEKRRVLPTFGSRDLLALAPNPPTTGTFDSRGVTHRKGSEINKTGIGGGSVFTMNGITFGLEVCLDHDKERLYTYYNDRPPTSSKAAVAGEPKVQIHLIPSWGSAIGKGRVVCPSGGSKPGPVFNVDGQRNGNESVFRLNDGKYSCDDHPDQLGDTPGKCPVVKKYYGCPGTDPYVSHNPGKCTTCTQDLVEWHRCMRPRSLYFCGDCLDYVRVPGNCSATTHPPQARQEVHQCIVGIHYCRVCQATQPAAGVCPNDNEPLDLYFGCTGCNKWILPLQDCLNGCPSGTPLHICGTYDHGLDCATLPLHQSRPNLCGNYHKASNPCPLHSPGPAEPEKCDKHFQAMGTSIPAESGPTEVASSNAPDHFLSKGHVLVYPAKDIPDPAVVT